MKSPFCVMVYTKYLGPTDTLGSRIVATTPGGPERVTVAYDYALSVADAHQSAADALIGKRLAANPYLAGFSLVCHGDTPDSKGFAFAYRAIYKGENS